MTNDSSGAGFGSGVAASPTAVWHRGTVRVSEQATSTFGGDTRKVWRYKCSARGSDKALPWQFHRWPAIEEEYEPDAGYGSYDGMIDMASVDMAAREALPPSAPVSSSTEAVAPSIPKASRSAASRVAPGPAIRSLDEILEEIGILESEDEENGIPTAGPWRLVPPSPSGAVTLPKPETPLAGLPVSHGPRADQQAPAPSDETGSSRSSHKIQSRARTNSQEEEVAIERRGREDAEARLSEALKGRASAVAKALEAETKLADALASKAGRVREEYPKYEDGAKIQFHSLKVKTEFNGQGATIICASVHRKHYEVRLSSGDTTLVHSRYIRPGVPQTEKFIIHSNALVLEAPVMFPFPPKIGALQSGSSSDSSSVSIFDRPSGHSQLLAVSTARTTANRAWRSCARKGWTSRAPSAESRSS